VIQSSLAVAASSPVENFGAGWINAFAAIAGVSITVLVFCRSLWAIT
jgi:hypothetical protein